MRCLKLQNFLRRSRDQCVDNWCTNLVRVSVWGWVRVIVEFRTPSAFRGWVRVTV